MALEIPRDFVISIILIVIGLLVLFAALFWGADFLRLGFDAVLKKF